MTIRVVCNSELFNGIFSEFNSMHSQAFTLLAIFACFIPAKKKKKHKIPSY